MFGNIKPAKSQMTIGQYTDFEKDIPICYVDADKKCYLIAKSGAEFLSKVQHWKEQLIPYTDIEFFDSYEIARNKYEFLDRFRIEKELKNV